jgi:hypothetical protein
MWTNNFGSKKLELVETHAVFDGTNFVNSYRVFHMFEHDLQLTFLLTG